MTGGEENRSSEEHDALKPARVSPELSSTLRFLAAPVGFYLLILIFHLNQIPFVLAGFATIFGIVLFARALRDPEPLLAVVILYMPLSKQFVASYAPGLNGTNALLLMLIISWAANASRDGRPMFVGMRNTTIVGAWAAISILSGLTAMLRISTDFILDEHLQDFVGWCMQFVVFFAFVNMIRDGKMARRLVVYICITFFLIICLGVQDLIEKMDATSIEKSRLLGPQGQPNDYGAWLVYTMAPLIAYFIHNVFAARAWLLAPLFVLVAKILLTTFSRGAYIGLGVATVAAGWVRGKAFLLAGGLVAVTILFVFPQVVPGSFSDRMAQTKAEDGESDKLDKSSETRLILWKAAVAMTLDYPIAGTGFKAFSAMKERYTEVHVDESDNHNMYLFISSQMGIPALFVFLFVVYGMYATGATLYRESRDQTVRIIGLGGVVMAAGVLGVNMFGSRMCETHVNGNFWVYLAILSHLWQEHEDSYAELSTPPLRS